MARQFDWAKRKAQQGGTYGFPHGHSVIWLDQPEIEKRPLYPSIGEVRQRVGETRADWMLKLRNLTVFPGDADRRGHYPDAADLPAAGGRPHRDALVLPGADRRGARTTRLAAAPVRGFSSTPAGWRPPTTRSSTRIASAALAFAGIAVACRAMPAVWRRCRTAPDETARQLGIHPAESGRSRYEGEAETPFHAPYREWVRLMQAGIAGRSAWS